MIPQMLAALVALVSAGLALRLYYKLWKAMISKSEPQPQSEQPQCRDLSPQQVSTPSAETKIDRYAVFDRNANPKKTHSNLSEAVKQWKEETKRQGSIFDLQTLKEVTPKPTMWDKFIRWLKKLLRRKRQVPVLVGQTIQPTQPMSDKERQELIQLLLRGAGKNIVGIEQEADPELLFRFVSKINTLDLPVFHVAKKRWEVGRRFMPVIRQRKKIGKKIITAFEDKTRMLVSDRQRPSITPENDINLRRIRSLSELKRIIPKRAFALPREIFERRLASRDLMVAEYQREEHYPEVLTESVPKQVIVDEPLIEDYVDFLEVSKEPRGQLLYILLDGSGSMCGESSYIAAAVAIAVIGRNLENSSRYFYRLFDAIPRSRITGKTREENETLIQRIVNAFYTGGDTEIKGALRVAVSEIRQEATPDDQPEILLISDGRDYFSAEDIYQLIGKDIILHTVMVNGRNQALKAHSTTYVELDGCTPESVSVGR